MGNQDGDVKALLERFSGGVPAAAAAAAVGKVNGPPRGLPPGFRFHPTDEELVLQYLRRKVLSRPLPADIIPDIELYKYEPWDLPLVASGDNQKVRYYFNLRAPKYPNGGSGGRANRAAGSGYWKATGRDRPVLASRDDRVVGMKKVLVFYRGKAPSGTRTDWVMHEYRLLPPAPPLPPAVPVGNNKLSPASAAAANAMPPPPAVPARAAAAAVPYPNWVLCRVFKKKKVGAARGREDMEDESDEEMEEVDLGVFPPPNFIDFLGPPRTGGGAAYPSASESSCVTEAAASSEEVESGAEVGNGGGGGGGRSLFLPTK